LVKRAGIDLVVALDASNSMLARDVKPSRLERAKLEVTALLERLNGDRVGLVVFAGDAFIQCPLTTDYAAARMFLRAVEPVSMATQGTAIADALYEARNVLEGGGRGDAGKAVLLITDGEDQRGDALEAAAAVAETGVRIFAVPVGGTEGEPIPVLDRGGNLTGYKKDKEGRTVLTRTDVTGLRDLTARGNGLLLQGAGADLGVLKFLPELEKMQKGEVESRLSVQYDDKYAWFAWPAFVLLCAAAALGEGPLLRRRTA
jgi:Ca-activated chloride channel family protein